MKTVSLVSFIFLVTVISNFAQVKKTAPTPKPSPSPLATLPVKVEPVPTQKVIVEKTNGDRLTGLFVGASSERITINISEAKIDIPMSEIASIRFNEPTVPIVTATPAPEVTTLVVEAAIVYKTGGAQPLARANMALFDKSLTSILSEAGIPTERNMDYPTTFGFAMKYPSQYGAFGQRAVPALLPHKVVDFSTDFQGKAFVNNIKEGSYWLVCYYQTRGGFAVWDLGITIKKGANYVVMDQNNAAVSF